MAAGTLKYSTSQFFPIGPVQKEAWAIARSSAPCRILISEEFHQNLRQLAQVFIRYRILPNAAPVGWEDISSLIIATINRWLKQMGMKLFSPTLKVFGYKGKTYWLVGMNVYRAQSLLDDIFLLDPENLEALQRWYDTKGEKKPFKKGVLENEEIAVVTPLPFDYAAMTAGGAQYQVDLTPEEDRKHSVHNISETTLGNEQFLVKRHFATKCIIIIDQSELDNFSLYFMSTSGGQPVRVSDPQSYLHEPLILDEYGKDRAEQEYDDADQQETVHVMKTRGGIEAIPTRATIVLHREAEEERKDYMNEGDKTELEKLGNYGSKDALEAIKRLRAQKKKDFEQLEVQRRYQVTGRQFSVYSAEFQLNLERKIRGELVCLLSTRIFEIDAYHNNKWVYMKKIRVAE